MSKKRFKIWVSRRERATLAAASSALAGGLIVFVLMRFGLLAYASWLFFANLFLLFPITPQVSSCYFGIGLTGLVLLLAMAGYGFYTSLGGQPLFGRPLLENDR